MPKTPAPTTALCRHTETAIFYRERDLVGDLLGGDVDFTRVMAGHILGRAMIRADGYRWEQSAEDGVAITAVAATSNVAYESCTPYASLCFGIGQSREPEMNAERHVKLFRNGRNQALRIPREMELPGSDAVIRKEGNRLIVEPLAKPSLLAVLATLEPLHVEFPEIDEFPVDDVEL